MHDIAVPAYRGTSPATTTAQILSGTKPTKLTIPIDTNSAQQWKLANSCSNGLNMLLEQLPLITPAVTMAEPLLPNCGYREYRAYSTEVGQERDEVAAGLGLDRQLRNPISQYAEGGEAAKQAWSFGGNKTPHAACRRPASATYNGRFVATAKTANYVKPSAATLTQMPFGAFRALPRDGQFRYASVTGTLDT